MQGAVGRTVAAAVQTVALGLARGGGKRGHPAERMLTQRSGSGWAERAWTSVLYGCGTSGGVPIYMVETFGTDYSHIKNWTDPYNTC